jgi:hypothetical protein
MRKQLKFGGYVDDLRVDQHTVAIKYYRREFI